MVVLHEIVGYIVIVLSIIVFIWSLLRLAGKVQGNRLRMVFIGLVDLQILIGIITFILHPMWGLFLLHPIAMLIAAALLHVLTKDSRSQRTQVVTYLVATLLFIVGVLLGR